MKNSAVPRVAATGRQRHIDCVTFSDSMSYFANSPCPGIMGILMGGNEQNTWVLINALEFRSRDANPSLLSLSCQGDTCSRHSEQPMPRC